MSGTKELIDAIADGNAEAIENTFQGVMSTKVGDKLDAMKKELASNVFKSPEEQEEIAGEPEVEAKAENEVPAEQPEVEEPADATEKV